MKRPKAKAKRVCSICGTTQGDMTSHFDGHVCETCGENTREGRDPTLPALRLQQSANRSEVPQRAGGHSWLPPDALEYKAASNALMAQETLREDGLPNKTLTNR